MEPSEMCEEEDTFDIDELVKVADTTEDLDLLDEIYEKIVSETAKHTEKLKQVKQENAELDNEANRDICLLAELDKLEKEELEKLSNSSHIVALKEAELQSLRMQQVDDLVQFEKDVHEIMEKFESAPKKYRPEALQGQIQDLLKDLEEKKCELQQYKQELSSTEQQLKNSVEDDETYMANSVQVFEESIASVEELNKNLRQSVQDLENKLQILMLEAGIFNI